MRVGKLVLMSGLGTLVMGTPHGNFQGLSLHLIDIGTPSDIIMSRLTDNAATANGDFPKETMFYAISLFYLYSQNVKYLYM